MKLIIVESPTKAKTISSFLGAGFEVLSSYGHVRDLPKSRLSIDVKNDFAPTYIIPVKAKENVEELRKTAAKADEIILASDEDREGEAIAWHLAQILEPTNTNTQIDTNNTNKTKKKHSRNSRTLVNSSHAIIKRIVFHEITKSAIEEALKNPREIDMNLVDAQQARRVLDRLVGYELSPFLWHKIRYGLSAGRVQSVALRLVVEREREIQKFNREEYWTIEGIFSKTGDKKSFSAKLFSMDGKSIGKMGITDSTLAHEIVNALKDVKYNVSAVNKKEVSKNPSPPFTTSTLQQEAARKLGFSAKQTMVVAQQLYENGHITYMRTDSLNLASSALAQAKQVIGENFGKEYQLDGPRYFTNKSKGAQEAHEAVRPTNLAKSPEKIGLKDRSQIRLYSLIWKRTIACQMQPARVEQTSADISTQDSKYIFRATGQVILFDGFIKVYTEGVDEPSEENGEGTLPQLEINDKISAKDISPLQHFTEPPARYSDATLIKALESFGVGRPSTYAPTLSTIQERGYVEKTDKKYIPTEIGFMVNDMLVEHFPEIVDVNFTAHIEEELDEIAEGKIPWTNVCREFYGPFKKHLEAKEAEVEKDIQVSDTPCPHCGKPMLIKFGRMGKFLACPEPGSKVTLPMPEEAAKIKELEEKTKGELCPICEKPMKVKRGRFSYFLGCVDYPKCKGISRIWNKTGFKCPLCQDTPERKDKPGDVVEKRGRGRGKPFWACTRWPDCQFIINKKPETQEELAELYTQWKKAKNEDKSKKPGKEKNKPTKKIKR
jgi:DNA topoisomerase-1